MVVATGDSAQFEKEEWMRKEANTNPRATTAVQPALAILDSQVEMYERPWMLEDSKKSRKQSISVFINSIVRVTGCNE